MVKTVLFQTIQFRGGIELISKALLFQIIHFSLSTVSMSKTVLFQTFQFSISTHFSSIWLIDRVLSCATTPGQSGHSSDGNYGVLCIPQSSSIAGPSSSDCSMSYPEHSFEGTYSSVEVQSVYSTTSADWAILGLWFFIHIFNLRYYFCLVSVLCLVSYQHWCSGICRLQCRIGTKTESQRVAWLRLALSAEAEEFTNYFLTYG